MSGGGDRPSSTLKAVKGDPEVDAVEAKKEGLAACKVEEVGGGCSGRHDGGNGGLWRRHSGSWKMDQWKLDQCLCGQTVT